MVVDWTLRYDRCVGVDFLSLFRPGGVAFPLVEYARHAPYAVDLQMRKDPKTGAQHASLYVGLTAVLTVDWRGAGRFALSANPTWSAGPSSPATTRTRCGWTTCGPRSLTVFRSKRRSRPPG